MSNVKVIEIKESIFADNNADAERLRSQLKEEKTFLLNLMSSPGSGKTTTLEPSCSRFTVCLKVEMIRAS